MDKFRPQFKKFIQSNLLTVLTVIGVISGAVFGFTLRAARDNWSQRDVVYIKFTGDIFLRMMKALILPLIVSSLISAIGSLDLSLSKRIGLRAVAYYMLTTGCAVILGIILVVTIRPGHGGTPDVISRPLSKNVTTADSLMDLIRHMFPPNLILATMKLANTVVEYPGNDSIPIHEWKINFEYQDGTNIMGLVVFSTVLGITLGIMNEKGKPLVDLFVSLSEATMIMTNWVVWFSPVGVCFLIAGQLIEVKDIGAILRKLGVYFGTVLFGLFLHGFIVLPVIFMAVTKTLPFRFVANMTQAFTTAFGTASSSATLPITIGCLEKKNGVDPRVARFVIPIGATINMDGTALYEAVAAIYIVQLCGMSLTLTNLVVISITATAASIGAAGIPQAGLVTMVMVLNAIGLPAEYVAFIYPVDWLLDRFRTAINVLGDSLGAGIVNHLSKEELDKLDENSPVAFELAEKRNSTTTPNTNAI